MDASQIAKDLSRGQQARDLIENPLLQEIFTTIEKEIFSVWQETKVSETEQREQAYLTQRGMNLFKAKLNSILNSGKIAAAEKAKLESNQVKKRKA